VLLIIFVTLALSLSALILAIQAYNYGNDVVAAYLLLIGFIGVASSTYVLFQTRKRIMRLRIETPPITTTIECRKCGFKSVREFQRGDYIFKEVEPCQKCNEKMLITAIYREVREKGREAFPF
jgi:DNA-directed RNA polymerase subunit RPC12/RpoP